MFDGPIFITGAGFIGREICAGSLLRGKEIVLVDVNPFALKETASFENVTAIQCDIGNLTAITALMKQFAPTTVIHTAAVTGAASLASPDKAWQVNAGGTECVVRSAAIVGVRQFVHLSSFAVYGSSDLPMVEERSPCLPSSTYGKSKLAAEKALEQFHDAFDQVGILRLAGVYGSKPGTGTTRSSTMIERLSDRCIAGLPLRFKAGVHRLDELIHVDDVLAALRAVFLAGTGKQVYNIGSGVHVTVTEIVGAFAANAPDVRHTFVDSDYDSVADEEINIPPLSIKRAKVELGFAPKVELAIGIGRSLCAADDHKRRQALEYN
ncbi:NAD-dependent epimerase/dehydratase family protein [Agrobacterium leguminum]|uniref:NAD-dependent epimerase/dehydratase family protein n=1 Tax=Agrobacterium leguminum TaxID=2792015 RepID=UPI003CE48338